MESITIYPNSKEEAALYKQLAKRLNNRFTARKVASGAKTKKEQFLDEFTESLKEIKRHERGEIELKTLKEVLNEL